MVYPDYKTIANWETQSALPVIWFAFYESPNFSFMATGTSEEHAKDALRKGLSAHAVDYKCAPDWWVDAFISTCSAAQGETLRDHWPIKREV